MSNKYSSNESNSLKREQDFIKDGVLQYDAQNNPALVRKVKIPFFKPDGISTYGDGSFFEINFPCISMHVSNVGLPDLYVDCRITNDDNSNDFFRLRQNDSNQFQRRVSKLFIKTDQFTAAQVAISSNTDINDYWIELTLFADAYFESGRDLSQIIGPVSGNNIRWPYEPYVLYPAPYPTQGDPVVVAGTIIPLCFGNPLRKCINIYISQPCLLFITNENGEYASGVDDRYMYLTAGNHTLKNGALLSLETLVANTVIYVSEEY